MGQPARTLVILPANLGDVIMATPVLEGLKAAAPEGFVAFLVEEGFEGGLVGSPHCDQVLRFPRKRIRDLLRSADGGSLGVDSLGGQVGAVRALQFDFAMNLSQHQYVSHFMGLLGAKHVAGQHYLREGNHAVTDPWSRYLYAIAFARRFNRLHATDVYRRIAAVHEHRGGYTVSISDDEKSEAACFIEGLGLSLDGRPLAVLQPGAALPAKRWPAAGFARLGSMLRDAGWQILVSGAPVEADLAAAIAGQVGEACRSAAGRTTFRRAVACLAHARLCVTGDTALMHAAAALDVHTCALFGATSPVETGPYGNGHVVLAGRCSERPCFCRHCRNMLCMKSIRPEVVFACAEGRMPEQDPGCDTFRTSLEPGGDYALVPICTRGQPYVNKFGASITLKSFDPSSAVVESERHEMDECVEESRAFAREAESLGVLLARYLELNDKSAIPQFEERKAALSKYGGIGAFWAAVLNLRLNSVPLLDARAGIQESCRACAETAGQITRALRVAGG